MLRSDIFVRQYVLVTESYFEALSLVYRVRADPRVEVAMCMILEGLERRYPIGIDVLCLLRCCHVGLSGK